MAFDYSEAAATALELLTEFGAKGTLTRRGAASTLNEDGSATPTGTGDAPVVGMEIAAGTSGGLSNAGAQGEAGGTRKFSATHLIAAIEPPPQTGDVMALNGKTLYVKDVRTVRPTDTTICHFLSCGSP